MKNKKIIEFLGYEWTAREFTGMYLLELFSSHPNVLADEYPPGTTSKEVSVFFMGEERFNCLLDESYIEDIDGNDNFKTTKKVEDNVNDFFGCLIQWQDLVESEKKASKKNSIES